MAKRSALNRPSAIAASSFAQTAKPSQDTQKVTLVGCIEMEKDYRARLHASPGGVLGTGLGEGKEFVLSSSTVAPGAKGGKEIAGDYSLSGKLEPELLRQIGKQVEIVGTVRSFSAPRSAEADKNTLPKLVVELWHPFKDYCPALRTQQ